MQHLKPAAALLLAFFVIGFSGCNGRDRGPDREHVDVTEHVDVREHVDEHPDAHRDEHPDPPRDERRDPPRDQSPCDRDHDPHCDDRR